LHSQRSSTVGLVFLIRRNSNRRLRLKIPRTFRRQLMRLRDLQVASHRLLERVRLLEGVQLRPARERRGYQASEANLDACFRARQQRRQVFRLHSLSGAKLNLGHDRSPV
jgi:hypothetical protein